LYIRWGVEGELEGRWMGCIYGGARRAAHGDGVGWIDANIVMITFNHNTIIDSTILYCHIIQSQSRKTSRSPNPSDHTSPLLITPQLNTLIPPSPLPPLRKKTIFNSSQNDGFSPPCACPIKANARI
jgi:hypothetical protein